MWESSARYFDSRIRDSLPRVYKCAEGELALVWGMAALRARGMMLMRIFQIFRRSGRGLIVALFSGNLLTGL